MSLSGRNQRYILKLSSTRLCRGKWNLKIKLHEARLNGELVALGESQLLRWIDELNGIQDCEKTISDIKSQINEYRKQVLNLYISN